MRLPASASSMNCHHAARWSPWRSADTAGRQRSISSCSASSANTSPSAIQIDPDWKLVTFRPNRLAVTTTKGSTTSMCSVTIPSAVNGPLQPLLRLSSFQTLVKSSSSVGSSG